MAFSRIKPGNWAVNEELTSAQMNSLDIDHANAVDKTGDVLTSGTIQLTSAAKIQASIHDSIVSSTDSGISTTVSHGVSIQNDTGLVLEGTTSWPCFRSGRPSVRTIAPVPQFGVTDWTFSTATLVGAGTGTQAAIFFSPHHGSTLTTVDVVFKVGSSHASVPAALPKVGVKRVNSADIAGAGSAPGGVVDLYSLGQAVFTPTPGTGAAWFASGNVQTWTVTCDQNNVIDNTKYIYFIQLIDENGANSAAGNLYFSMRATYTNITSMQFR